MRTKGPHRFAGCGGIALASQGLMPLEAGIALILGANVGTCDGAAGLHWYIC